jgi:hypothetical protein
MIKSAEDDAIAFKRIIPGIVIQTFTHDGVAVSQEFKSTDRLSWWKDAIGNDVEELDKHDEFLTLMEQPLPKKHVDDS